MSLEENVNELILRYDLLDVCTKVQKVLNEDQFPSVKAAIAVAAVRGHRHGMGKALEILNNPKRRS